MRHLCVSNQLSAWSFNIGFKGHLLVGVTAWFPAVWLPGPQLPNRRVSPGPSAVTAESWPPDHRGIRLFFTVVAYNQSDVTV